MDDNKLRLLYKYYPVEIVKEYSDLIEYASKLYQILESTGQSVPCENDCDHSGECFPNTYQIMGSQGCCEFTNKIKTYYTNIISKTPIAEIAMNGPPLICNEPFTLDFGYGCPDFDMHYINEEIKKDIRNRIGSHKKLLNTFTSEIVYDILMDDTYDIKYPIAFIENPTFQRLYKFKRRLTSHWKTVFDIYNEITIEKIREVCSDYLIDDIIDIIGSYVSFETRL